MAAFGAVPRRGIHANMKTAVGKVGMGKARSVNIRFQAMCSHYLFETEFCNPASGWEKGTATWSTRCACRRAGGVKPRALRNGAPFKTMPEVLQRLQRHLLRHGGDRVMRQVLAAVPVHGLEAILVAVEMALEPGRPSAEHVLNVLYA